MMVSKKLKLSLIFLGFGAVLIAISGCGTTRSEFDKGYDLGSSDTAKHQYWQQVNLQKQHSILQSANNNSEKYRVVEVPVEGKTSEGVNISSHFVKLRVIDN